MWDREPTGRKEIVHGGAAESVGGEAPGAYQELGVAAASDWMARAGDRELNDLVRPCTLANIRLFETAYLQIEQGLLDERSLERLGWRNFLESTFLLRMWPQVRDMTSPAFRDYLEALRPELQGV